MVTPTCIQLPEVCIRIIMCHQIAVCMRPHHCAIIIITVTSFTQHIIEMLSKPKRILGFRNLTMRVHSIDVVARVLSFLNMRQFSNHESRLLSQSPSIAIIVILDLTPYLLRWYVRIYPRIMMSKSHENTLLTIFQKLQPKGQ